MTASLVAVVTDVERDGRRVGVGCREPGFDPLGHDALRFVDERDDHLGLGHDAHHLALHEEVAFAAPRGNTEVGLPGLAGSVHDASHDRDLQGNVALLQRGLSVGRNADDVDFGAAARRAGDEVETLALPQTQRLEQRPPCLRLLDRISRQ